MMKKFFGGGAPKKEKEAAPPPAPPAAAVSPPASNGGYSKPAISRNDSADRGELLGNRTQAATNGTAKLSTPKSPTSPGGAGKTEEEEEEEDVDALKTQIRFTKQESLASTQNALRAAEMAEETGRRTLNRLGEQGDKLINTEKNLNLAKNHGKVAEAKAKELKTLNRSMFAVHVANPFNSANKAAEKEEEILRDHQNQRDERAGTRAASFNQKQRVGGALNAGGGFTGQRQKMSLADKAKFQFEADEEDDKLEDEIDDNLGKIGDAAGRLKMLAMATSKEVDDQNQRIDRLNNLTGTIDDQIAVNTQRLKKFGA